MLPGDIKGGQYEAFDDEHSHAVKGVINAESYVVAVLCFRLRLILPLFTLQMTDLRNGHTSPGRGEENRTISRVGICPQTFL